MITAGAVAELLGRWWHHYDEGHFDELAELLTEEVAFRCRTDTGTSPFEEFVRADLTGRDAVMAWQVEHRRASPFPLRHHASNVHLTGGDDETARFSSYILVNQVADGMPALVSSGVVHGTAHVVGGQLRLAELEVVLDTRSSVAFSER